MAKNIYRMPIVILSVMSLILYISIVYAERNYNYMLGDVNEDGSIDIADVVYLFKHRNLDLEDGDVNGDNGINIADVVVLFRNYDEMRKSVKYSQNMKLKYYDENGNEVNPYNGEN